MAIISFLFCIVNAIFSISFLLSFETVFKANSSVLRMNILIISVSVNTNGFFITISYLIFRAESASKAKSADSIQNLVTTCVSFQPLSSKW